MPNQSSSSEEQTSPPPPPPPDPGIPERRDTPPPDPGRSFLNGAPRKER
jgi:hypothetical protein